MPNPFQLTAAGTELYSTINIPHEPTRAPLRNQHDPYTGKQPFIPSHPLSPSARHADAVHKTSREQAARGVQPRKRRRRPIRIDKSSLLLSNRHRHCAAAASSFQRLGTAAPPLPHPAKRHIKSRCALSLHKTQSLPPSLPGLLDVSCIIDSPQAHSTHHHQQKHLQIIHKPSSDEKPFPPNLHQQKLLRNHGQRRAQLAVEEGLRRRHGREGPDGARLLRHVVRALQSHRSDRRQVSVNQKKMLYTTQYADVVLILDSPTRTPTRASTNSTSTRCPTWRRS